MGGAFRLVEVRSTNWFFLYLMESLACIGVNGFILITGYFSYDKTKVSLRKPIGLLLYVIAYNVFFFLINIIFLGGSFSMSGLISCLIPHNWYITLYIVLVMVSPYLNIVIRQLSKNNIVVLLGVLIGLFSVWPTLLDLVTDVAGINFAGANTIALNGSSAGYSIVNFVLLYLIGAAIHKWNLFQKNKYIDLAIYIGSSALIFLGSTITTTVWNYSCILVIVSAVCLFNFFRKIHINSNIINLISKTTLGIYLISTQQIIFVNFWKLFNLPKYCQGSIGMLAVNIMLCSAITFIVCALIDWTGRLCCTPISKLLNNISILKRNIIDLNDEI